MNLQEAFQIFSAEGYCLWAGAGVSLHLAGGSTHKPCNWQELIESMESEAGITQRDEVRSYAKRFDRVLRKLQRRKFSIRLKELILMPLASAIVANANRFINKNELPNNAQCVPEEILQLATIGTLANPIVNFNIETLSSIAIAAATSNYQINPFSPQKPGIPEKHGDERDRRLEGIWEQRQFGRHIYHPHGAINTHGGTILAESEYRYLNGTLAFQLGVHAAFQSNLMIVGMSLEDSYLREQLAQFRQQINTIVWFVEKDELNSFSREIWALENNINIIIIERWDLFWRQVLKYFPKPDSANLATAWVNILLKNALLMLSQYSISLLAADNLNKESENYLENITFFYERAMNRGEDYKNSLSLQKHRLYQEKYARYLTAILQAIKQ